MENLNLAEKNRLNAVLNNRTDIEVANILGKGNFGEAYLLTNNQVLKITTDKNEYNTARNIKLKDLKNLIYVYDCWKMEFVYDGYDEYLFCIIEEKLDVVSHKILIENFFIDFKKAWYNEYFPSVFKVCSATKKDLNEYMRNPEKHTKAIDFIKEYLTREGCKRGYYHEYETIYYQLINGCKELREHSPTSEVDFNEGNVGYDKNGTIKILDIQ